jgi:hypothetical protein
MADPFEQDLKEKICPLAGVIGSPSQARMGSVGFPKEAVDRLVAALGARAPTVRGTVKGGCTVRCLSPEDRNALLSIGVGEDGRVLLPCHAGYGFAEVVASLYLRVRGRTAVVVHASAHQLRVIEDGLLATDWPRCQRRARGQLQTLLEDARWRAEPRLEIEERAA